MPGDRKTDLQCPVTSCKAGKMGDRFRFKAVRVMKAGDSAAVVFGMKYRKRN